MTRDAERQPEDLELEAMAAISRALGSLREEDPPAVERVLRWAYDRYGPAGPERRELAEAEPGRPREPTGGASAVAPMGPQDVHELLEAVQPADTQERILAAAYWYQVVEEQPVLAALQLNAVLRNAGHGVANITRAVNPLISARPQLMLQVRKHGTSRQARKEYKLTREGIARVRGLIEERQQRTS